MSEKAEKKPEAEKAGDDGKEKKKGGFLTKTPVLVGGAMVLEAAVLFAGFKMLGGGAPKHAEGAELVAEGAAADTPEAKAAADKKKPAEIPVVEFKAPNKLSGRAFIYDVSIVAVVKSADKEMVETAIKEREALIKDRVRTIIAQSDPEKLGGGSEPGLETLRRQVKYQLDQIVGAGVIEEVLVPRCIPFRSDF
jgi:flagellar basal body-associated protein FliL